MIPGTAWEHFLIVTTIQGPTLLQSTRLSTPRVDMIGFLDTSPEVSKCHQTSPTRWFLVTCVKRMVEWPFPKAKEVTSKLVKQKGHGLNHLEDAIFCYFFKVPVDSWKKKLSSTWRLKSHFVNPFSRAMGPLPTGRTPWLKNRGYFTNRHLPRWSSKSQISYTGLVFAVVSTHTPFSNQQD